MLASLRVFVLWCTLALVLAGCGPKPVNKDTTPAEVDLAGAGVTPTDTPTEGATTEAAGPRTRVDLLEPGQEPRRALRYDLAAMRKEEGVMDMGTTMAVTVGGNAGQRVKLPIMRMTLVTEPQGMTPAGTLRVTSRITAAKTTGSGDPAVVAAMNEELAAMVGLVTHAEISARGETSNTELEVPANASPQLQQMLDGLRQGMDDMTAPLPEEPVGVGARWRVTSTLDLAAMKSTRVVEAKLERVTAQGAELSLTVSMQAAQQPLKVPGLPPGATATLDSLTASGQGRMSIQLDRLTPKSEISVSVQTRATVTVNGEISQANSDVTTDVRMDRVTP